MVKKLYKVTIAQEDKSGLSENFDSFNILATTAEKAIATVKNKLDIKGEFVHEIDCLGVVDKEN